MVRDVLQPALRDAPRGDVLHLEDEAGRVFVGAGKNEACKRDRDHAAVRTRASQFQRAGGGGAREQVVELARKRRVVVAMHECAEVRTQELVLPAGENLAQRRVRLQDDAILSDERHADRRVGERLLEPAFALLQLRQMARRFGGLALGGGDALLLGELGVLDVTEVKAVCEHHDREDGQRRESSRSAPRGTSPRCALPIRGRGNTNWRGLRRRHLPEPRGRAGRLSQHRGHRHQRDDAALRQPPGQLQAGELVVMDMGAKYGFYSADVTRTIPVSGRFITAPARASTSLCSPRSRRRSTRPARHHDGAARPDLARVHHGPPGDLGAPGLRPYFIHGLGHWIGIDVHDVGGLPRRSRRTCSSRSSRASTSPTRTSGSASRTTWS